MNVMSNGEELNVPTIVGTNGELVSLRLTSENPNYINLDVNLELPGSMPAFHQRVATATYSLPDIDQLAALLDGQSEVVFNFSALNFRCTISEHTWGARYAFITEGTITTIQSLEFAPWPTHCKIGDFILDRNPTAACLSFAFRCDYERLRIFHGQLSCALTRLLARDA